MFIQPYTTHDNPSAEAKSWLEHFSPCNLAFGLIELTDVEPILAYTNEAKLDLRQQPTLFRSRQKEPQCLT